MSAGIAPDDDGADLTTVLKHADTAMYQAKTGAAPAVAIYSPAMSSRLRDWFDLEARLRRAVLDDGLALQFQPKFRLADDRIVGVEALLRWCDGEFFMTIVGLLFGGDWAFDEAFVKDRSELIGAPFDPAQMAAAAPALVGQLRQHLDLMETQLADGRAFLTGAAPDAIDAAVYCQTTFIRWGKGVTARIVDEFPRLCAWERRVAAIGHGERQADVSREDAIAIARDAAPARIAYPTGDGAFAPGDAVTVKFHDANSPPLEGTLLSVDQRTLSLKPARSEAGDLHIHMPRSVGALSRQ